jgi:hypothetical protein
MLPALLQRVQGCDFVYARLESPAVGGGHGAAELRYSQRPLDPPASDGTLIYYQRRFSYIEF